MPGSRKHQHKIIATRFFEGVKEDKHQFSWLAAQPPARLRSGAF
jgi:hypothetical protein